MPVKEARVPSAHLMIAQASGVFDTLALHPPHRRLEKVVIDPFGQIPMLFWNEL
jgi:hypothetical protein